MSDTATPDHAAEDHEGRHRGEASAEEAEQMAPHGKHRRITEG